MTATEIVAHYNDGREEHRLTRSLGRLEWLRTWEILDRHLPAPPARVLDVGGGTGAYSLALSSRGYEVRLIDAVPLHVERAQVLSRASAAHLVSAEVGDARGLPQGDGSQDVVLMLGPLYHLTEPHDRIKALEEARRVLVPGGLLFAAYISRFASACDGIQEGRFGEDWFAESIERELIDGVHRNPTKRTDNFTTAYFHRPEEIRARARAGGLSIRDSHRRRRPWMGERVP